MLIFPEAERVVVEYLSGAFAARGDGVRVAAAIPSPRPPRLVRVTLLGGSRRNLVQDDAMVLVECWESSQELAAKLAGLARALMGGLDTDVAHVPQDPYDGPPVFLPDPLTSSPRYQFAVNVRLRAEVLEA